MSRKQRKARRRLERERATPLTRDRPLKQGFLAKTWKIVAATLTIGGAFGAVVLWPRIGMFCDATLNPLEPFATPFALKNDGYESLQDIEFACDVNNFGTATRKSVFTVSGGLGITAKELRGEMLRPDETTEVCLPVTKLFNLGEPATHIDIDVFVSFSIRYIPHRFTRCFRFVTQPDSSRHLRWIAKGFGKTCSWPVSFLGLFEPKGETPCTSSR